MTSFSGTENRRFYPAITPASETASFLILISAGQLLCRPGDNNAVDFIWPEADMPLDRNTIHSKNYLGQFDNAPLWVWEIAPGSVSPPPGIEWRTLRSLLGRVDDQLFDMAGLAQQIVSWWNDYRYCGRCGKETAVVSRERAKYCDTCNAIFYPRISPCIIVVVTKGEQCLLARNASWKNDYYSALAGFVECGESAERAVMREVMEEVGIEIKNIRYYGSQPWPFPGQLMLGFHAEHARGEICIDGREISDARWWRYDKLPPHPGITSISGKLIQDFVATCASGA